MTDPWYAAGRMLHEHRAKTLTSSYMRWRFIPLSGDDLIFAPQDFHTPDPILANDLAVGWFLLGNKLVEVGDQSPFDFPEQDVAWVEALHSFHWLRHFRAVEDPQVRSAAARYVRQWLDHGHKNPNLKWRLDITAERLIAWLRHSPLVINGADTRFYKRFTRSIMREAKLLYHLGETLPEGKPRLKAALACTMVGLSFENHDRFLRKASKRLTQELSAQVLPDGGHISRNPSATVELLSDILPLRECYHAKGIETPPEILSTIDRMMPMMRFFRHGNGAVVNFNGAKAYQTDLLAKIMTFDDVMGEPVENAQHTGYQRVRAGDTLIVMDTGGPPPAASSQDYHAGCLSFEMSDGGHRLIVNCGKTQLHREKWADVARQTAAHSTLSINTLSSMVFVPCGYHSKLGKSTKLAGRPLVVDVTRRSESDGTKITALHNGFVPETGLLHDRSLFVTKDGSEVRGVDRVALARNTRAAKGANHHLHLRFHLNPRVRAVTISPSEIFLIAGTGRAWLFTAKSGAPSLEESVFLSDSEGPKRTKQIALLGLWPDQDGFEWTLRRVTDPLELTNYLAKLPHSDAF